MSFKNILILLILIGITYSRKITRCEFVQELINANVENIEDHLCVVFGETDERHTDTHYGKVFGIYRINTQWWCGQNDDYEGSCGTPCYRLLDDDLKDDIHCASVILKHQGLKAWGIVNKCKKPDLNDCKVSNKIFH